MNGHHESCECSNCERGRDIGMHTALALLKDARDALIAISASEKTRVIREITTFLTGHEATQ